MSQVKQSPKIRVPLYEKNGELVHVIEVERPQPDYFLWDFGTWSKRRFVIHKRYDGSFYGVED